MSILRGTWLKRLALGGSPPALAAEKSLTGISIANRTMNPGDLFVAIKGESTMDTIVSSRLLARRCGRGR
jgi:UDP-N-acetylmuramyl tripeptide synthase